MEIAVYWDTQVPGDPGWAWRVEDEAATGSGPLTSDTTATEEQLSREALYEAAHHFAGNGIAQLAWIDEHCPTITLLS